MGIKKVSDPVEELYHVACALELFSADSGGMAYVLGLLAERVASCAASIDDLGNCFEAIKEQGGDE
jgi:hypothetical protein